MVFDEYLRDRIGDLHVPKRQSGRGSVGDGTNKVSEKG